MKVLLGLVSNETSFPGLHLATFSWCFCMEFLCALVEGAISCLFLFLWGHHHCWSRTPPIRPFFNLNYSVNVLYSNVVTLEVRLQHMNLGKGEQFNPQQNLFIRIHLHVLFFLRIPAVATSKEQLMHTTPADAFISISFYFYFLGRRHLLCLGDTGHHPLTPHEHQRPRLDLKEEKKKRIW